MIYNLIIENKYKINLKNKLGEGSFGIIFKGMNMNTNKNVAIKIENKSKSLLKNEAKIYNILNHINGIPKLRSYGCENGFNYMVIDYIGESLEKYKLRNKGIIILENVKKIGIQIIDIIEQIHNNNIIHRDIKPENILIYKNKIYIIDYGLSKLYMINNKHISKSKIQSIIGNVRYSSVNIHNNISPSRRDDIESILYIIIYLLYGKLPWQINTNNINEIGNIKKDINYFKDIFVDSKLLLLLKYVREIKYIEKPNYIYIKQIINSI